MKPLIGPQGRFNVIRLNAPKKFWPDLYHNLMRMPWKVLILWFVVLYIGVNFIFAGLYYPFRAGLSQNELSFFDVFFFSVQTFSTVGYGAMAPNSLPLHIVMTAQSMCGLLMAAMLTGVTFAKFSRPTARVLFCDNPVVYKMNGKDCLVIRVANARETQIIDLNMQVTLSRDTRTLEGQSIRRFFPLKLDKERTPLFALSWLIIHEINSDSPMFGKSQEDMISTRDELLVSITGLDGIHYQTVFSLKSYLMEDLRWGHKFADMVDYAPEGERVIDYSKFNSLIPSS